MRTMFDRHTGQQAYSTIKKIFFLPALLFLVAELVGCGSSFIHKQSGSSGMVVQKTLVTNGADQWNGDKQITKLTTSFSLLNTGQIGVSPLFDVYYQNHGGMSNLGTPLTTAFPIAQGWLQFFEAGALLLPTQRQPHGLQNADTLLSTLVNKGTKDSATGIIRLPLLQALLTAGSMAPIGGAGSELTYVDLRKATNPTLMQSPPATNVSFSSATSASSSSCSTLSPTDGNQGVFVKEGTRAGKDVGHCISQPFWSYINRSDVSPEGWQKDFGAPLTEVLPFTITHNGSVQHMFVQVFSHDGLLFDQDRPDMTGQPAIQRLYTGLDYLQTFGLPDVKPIKRQTAWSGGESVLLDYPGTGHEIAHIGQNFPLVLLGDSNWSAGLLWYHVQWFALNDTRSGWVAASAITFTSPGMVGSDASFDALLPDLASYLNDNGFNVSAVLYDVVHQISYTYNSSAQFIMASSVKVPIMLTFLDMVEQQGREPDDDEMGLLTTMIENSNNDSASELYNDIGNADGIMRYLQKIGVMGLSLDDDAWGYSLTTPQTMVNLLTLLYEGKILNDAHRALALSLMEHIEPDQQVGIGDTAPDGATIAMKDGWVIGPDDQWAMNSSGIVTINKETYILAIYTQEQPTLEDGQAIVRQVCSSVVSLLNA